MLRLRSGTKDKLVYDGWRRSPENLKKIDQVIRLRAMRMTWDEVARAMQCSRAQAQNYGSWAKELYREQIVLNQHDLLLESIAAFDALISEGWKHLIALGRQPGKQANYVSGLMAQIQAAEWKRAQLLGLVREAERGNREMSDAEIAEQLGKVAVRIGLRLVAPGFGPDGGSAGRGVGDAREAEFFDPDGESGISFDAGPEPPEPSELHALLPHDVPGGGGPGPLSAPAVSGEGA